VAASRAAGKLKLELMHHFLTDLWKEQFASIASSATKRFPET